MKKLLSYSGLLIALSILPGCIAVPDYSRPLPSSPSPDAAMNVPIPDLMPVEIPVVDLAAPSDFSTSPDLLVPVPMCMPVVSASATRPGLVRIPAGSFIMGSPSSEPGRDSDETQHRVTLTRPFLIAEIEVTQAQFSAVLGYNPSTMRAGNMPVHNVIWLDAADYCNALSAIEGLTPCYQFSYKDYASGSFNVNWDKTCTGYRLPTEAEWEYAARAGQGFYYAGSDNPDKVAYYGVNTGGFLQTVRQKAPNAWCLFDMSGNIAEWVWDAYTNNYGASGDAIDPVGPTTGSFPTWVFRGGHYQSGAPALRVAERGSASPTRPPQTTLGFRIARTTN